MAAIISGQVQKGCRSGAMPGIGDWRARWSSKGAFPSLDYIWLPQVIARLCGPIDVIVVACTGEAGQPGTIVGPATVRGVPEARAARYSVALYGSGCSSGRHARYPDCRQ